MTASGATAPGVIPGGGAPPRILITGATGFLGGSLVERLLAHGERRLRLTVRSGSRRARVLAAAARHPGAELEFVDANLVSPSDARRAVEGVDVIYHLAASLRGAPADMFLNTVVASKNLLDALPAVAGRPRVVLVSSFSVYGVAELGRGVVVDEHTPLEPHPQKRDLYAHVKLRQERLFREYAERLGFPLVVLRPGVIYGPGGSAFSSRVGLDLFGLFLNLGGPNLLPLSFVDNCSDAMIVAARAQAAGGEVYNVNDDELPTCAEYLAGYERSVRHLRTLRIPYPALSLLSRAVERYHTWSRGQLPAIFTPYKSATTWGGNRFDNGKLKRLGWRQEIPTPEGLRRTFDWLRSQLPKPP
jgi:nucleoside-diphosphate-sugar epimerase